MAVETPVPAPPCAILVMGTEHGGQDSSSAFPFENPYLYVVKLFRIPGTEVANGMAQARYQGNLDGRNLK